MRKKTDTRKAAAFDPTKVKTEFENSLPKIVTELADLFEQPLPRLSKRDKRQISQDFSWGIDVSTPHVKALEEMNGDPARLLEGYEHLEQMMRKYLRRCNVRLRRNEDAFDCLVRQSERLLKAPYRLKRLKQFSLIRPGVQTLIRSAMAAPGGLKASEDLIIEFGRKHLKEYLRFANAVDARLSSYGSIDLSKATHRNITRVADVYRDSAAAFENRLRLLVGLNFIAVGRTKAYSELRSLGYNPLLQAVESSKNPLLHFLKSSVDRHVRNALSHNGVSSSLSKRVVVFVNYAPHKMSETEIIWTMSKFIRETKKLLVTILGAAYLENEFIYVRTYCTVEAMKDMLRAQRESAAPPGNAA
jgi:hypothetical protein